MTEHGFSGPRAADIVGITFRRLDHWTRIKLVRPSHTEAAGSGTRRMYSYRDLLELRIIKRMRDSGISLVKIGKVLQYVRDSLGGDLASANLVIDGPRSVLVKTGEELIDILQNGQGVLNVLPLAGVKDDVDVRIVDLYPEMAEQVIDPLDRKAAGDA